jgi:hypothetical protein
MMMLLDDPHSSLFPAAAAARRLPANIFSYHSNNIKKQMCGVLFVNISKLIQLV